jgi:hypothetical protein
MKTFFFLPATVLCMAACSSVEPAADEPGTSTTTTYNVSGYIVDNLNMRQAAVVSLISEARTRDLTTGSNGEFNFTGVGQGAYTVEATKEGYNGTRKEITVNHENVNIGALLLTHKPTEILTKQETLDFGESHNSLSLSFQILSYLDEEWTVTHNCPWILKIEPGSGTLAYNEKEKTPPTVTVSVQIDRERLVAGKNEDKIQIRTSSNGGADIIVVAYNISRPAVTTKNASPVTSVSATFNGAITDVGTPAYTERGFVYDTKSMTTQPALPATARKVTKEKTPEADYSADVSGLSPNTTYYVRAFATNDNGTAYGNEVNFTSGGELATLSTRAATNISANAAELGGNIITTGAPPYTERGICYHTSPSPTLDNNINKVIITGNGTGNFSRQVSGLSPGTKYYVRAYAKSGDSGAAYGDEISFTTHAPVSVTTLSVSSTSITTSSAKVSGNIVSVGEPAYTEKGICYGTWSNLTVNNAFRLPVSGGGVGSFSANIDGLDANTTYYACAYAINPSGTVYGNTVSFKTKLERASVSTQTPTTLSGTLVRLNGTIISAGNPPYIERGFVCSMSSAPTVSDTKVIVPGQGTGTFSANFGSESKYITSYHVRAYVISADGSVEYGGGHIFFFDVIF